MTRSHWLCVAAFSLMTTPVFAEMTGNINGFLGQKTLDSDDWDPLDQQAEIGAMFDIRDTNWPVSIAADLLGSSDDATIGGVDVTGTTLELNIGARKVFDLTGSQLHPYVGGGLALITAEIEGESGGLKVSDDDTKPHPGKRYRNAATVRIFNHFSISAASPDINRLGS